MLKFTEFKRDILEGTLKTLYILTGEEIGVMEKYLNMIEYTKLESFNVVAQLLRSHSLFTHSRKKPIYVIHGDDSILKCDVEDVLSIIGDRAVVIFVYDRVDKRKKFFKTASKYIYEFKEITNSYVYIRKVLKIDEDAARYLADKCNNDILTIDMEMEKLKILGKTVTKELIDEVVSNRVEDEIFLFIDYILSRDARNAHRLYRDMKMLNKNEILFINLLYNNFKIILLVKGMYDKTDNQISKDAKLNFWQVKHSRNIVDKYFKDIPMEFILKYLKSLQELEVLIKTGKVDGEMGFQSLMNEFMEK